MSGNSNFGTNYSYPFGSSNKQASQKPEPNTEKEIAQMFFDAETDEYVQNSDVKGIESQMVRVTRKVPSRTPEYVVSTLYHPLTNPSKPAKSWLAPEVEIKSESPTPQSRNMTAFAFDIDGVLIRSKEPLYGARETLVVLQHYRIPFIFLTNGGGKTEEDHARHMGQLLDLRFSGEQFVQSHTPFRTLLSELQDSNMLVLGGVGQQNCDVAEAYGFRHVLSSSDIFRMVPDIYPFAELTELNHLARGRNLENFPRNSEGLLKIDAIFVFSSPRDWGLDIQLVVDLLLSRNGVLGTSSRKNGDPSLDNSGYQQDGQPNIFFCNPDLTWASKYPQPRMAQGAFAGALEGVWASRTGRKEILNRFMCGKPTQITYEYAEKALLDHHTAQHNALNPGELQPPPITSVYMVGDNPASDIAGANAFESPNHIPWRSILVETGVYTCGTVPEHPPTAVLKGVKEAVKWAMQQEGWPLEKFQGW